MNELQKLYDVLVREGKYTKSFEEFQTKWGQDQAYKEKVFEVVSRDRLYTKDKDSFFQKYSGVASAPLTAEEQIPIAQEVKKKDTVSPFVDGGSELTKFDPRTGQVVQETPEFTKPKERDFSGIAVEVDEKLLTKKPREEKPIVSSESTKLVVPKSVQPIQPETKQIELETNPIISFGKKFWETLSKQIPSAMEAKGAQAQSQFVESDMRRLKSISDVPDDEIIEMPSLTDPRGGNLTKYKAGEYKKQLAQKIARGNKATQASIELALKLNKDLSNSDVISSLTQVNDGYDLLNFISSSIGQTAAQVPLAIASGGGMSYAMESGNIYLETVKEIAEKEGITPVQVIQQGKDQVALAEIGGAISGALDLFGAKKVLDAFGLDNIKKDLRRRALTILVNSQVEGATEVGQEFISSAAKGLGVEGELRTPTLTQALDAYAAGMFGSAGIQTPSLLIKTKKDVADEIVQPVILDYGDSKFGFIRDESGRMEMTKELDNEEQAISMSNMLSKAYKGLQFTIEEVQSPDPYKPTKYRIVANEIETKPTEQDAIQEQAAGEVPVQSGTGVSQEVAQGEPQAEPQVVAEEGQEKITVFRGKGNNVMNLENDETLWVAEDEEVAKNYAGVTEEGVLDVEKTEVNKPVNSIELPYKLATDVRASNIGDNLRSILANLVKEGRIAKENISKASGLIRDFEEKAGKGLELFTTKINKPESREAFSKAVQALGFDSILQKESAAEGGTPTNTYGVFKKKYESLVSTEPQVTTEAVVQEEVVPAETRIAELEKEKSKLTSKALKQFPQSPAQLKTRARIDEINTELNAIKSEAEAVSLKTPTEEVTAEEVTTAPKLVRDISVLITPATVRAASPLTKRIKTLSVKYDKLVKEFSKTKNKKTLDKIKEAEAQILNDSKQEIVDNVSKVKGVSVSFGSDKRGLWDGSFEPSLNMLLSISPQADTQAVSEMLFDFSEKYSQDAFILETDSNYERDVMDGSRGVPLTEFDENGLMHYPQIVYTFDAPITDEQVADLSVELQNNGVDAFSINNDEIKVSVIKFFPEDSQLNESEQYEERTRDLESKTIATAKVTSDVLGSGKNGRSSVRIKKSSYQGAKNEGTADQSREYDRGDVLKPFQETVTDVELRSTELAKLRQKQIDLQSKRQQLSKEEQERFDELNRTVQPTVQKTFEVNKALYEDAKSEVEKIAEEATKTLNASLSPFPIKRPERASVKTIRWYNSFTEKLGDGARVNIVVENEADAKKVFDSIDKKYPISKGDKDLRRLREVTELGYPKKLIEVRTSNGIIAEIQVITNEAYLAKDGLSGFTGDQKQKNSAKTKLDKIRKRLGWAIPDGLGHYFYEIQRDINVDDNLRDEATRLSNLYYDAFTNPKSTLNESFMDEVIAFKQKVDSADKSNWDRGNEGKTPQPLAEYISEVSSKTPRKPEPVVAEEAIAEFVPLSPADIKESLFNEENAVDFEVDFREDTRGRRFRFLSSITIQATDGQGNPVGTITKLSDGENKLSFTVEDANGRAVEKGKQFPTLRDAKVALAEAANKIRQKEFEKQQKVVVKETETTKAKAEKAKARETARKKAAEPQIEEEVVEEIKGKIDELLELDPKQKGTGQKILDGIDGLIKDIEKFEKNTLGINIALPVMKTILQGIRALVQGGMVLNDAIKKAAKDNNVSVRDVVNGINAVAQILPIQAEYDALMTKADAMIARQKSKRIPDKSIVSNLDTMVRDFYKDMNLNDAQRKIMEREVRAKMGVGPRKAASIGRVIGALKDITNVSRKEKLQIISRIRDLSRDVAKDLAQDIKDLAKEGKITAIQAANIVAKFGKVNMLNEMSVSNFVDYMAKVFADADYDNKISGARSRMSKARKNIATKIGIADGLMLPLQKLFSINPELIPDTQLERYLELLDMFSANEAVLPLEAKNTVKKDVDAILNEINNEQSRADELAEVFSKSDNQVFEDGDLDYAASLKKMVKEGDITEEDAELMRKYKQDIIPQVEPTPLSDEEIAKKKEDHVAELKKTKIATDGLPSRDENKLAKRLANLIKDTSKENLMQLSLTDLKNLLKVTSNINNNYLPHYAQVMVEKINAIKNGKVIANAVKKAKPLAFSTLYSRFKAVAIRSQRTGIAELVRRTPSFNIDQVLGNFKTKDIFNALFEQAAEGEANFKAELKKVQNILENAEAKVAKSFKLNPDETLMSKFKMMTYMIQLEYESNKGSQQVNPAASYLKETIKHIDGGKSRFGERDANMLQDILDNYSTNGEIDLDKLNKSFNQAEKDAINDIRGINESLKDKAQYTAAIIRGDAIDPLNNYVHLNVLHDTEPLDVSAATDFLNQSNNSRRPSTRAKSLIERTKGAKPLNFDVFSSAQRGAKFVLLDYNLTEPIRTARRTINQATADLEAEGRLPKEQRDIKNAIDGAFEESVTNLLTNSILQNTFADEVIDFIGKQGYRAVLAGTGRFVAELTSNVSFALLADPKGFVDGIKYRGFIMSTDAPLVMENVNSKQTNRVFPSDTLSGRLVDTSILNQATGIQGRSSKNPVLNKMQQIYNLTIKKPQNLVELTADTLISTPDKLVMRPLWFGSFANEFKKASGKDVDFEKIAANDQAYMDANKEAIEQAKKLADERSVMAGATDNAFMGILKGTLKPNQSGFAKAFNNFNNYMTRFLIFEYVTARTAIYAMVGDGSLSKKQGAAMLGAVFTRMTVYTLLSQIMASGIMGLIGFGDEEEEDEKSLMQKIGQSITGAFSSLLFGRDFGNATKLAINYGLEEFNERYLDFLREGEYDPYKDGIAYSLIPRDDRPDDSLPNFLMTLSGSLGPAFKTADLIYKNKTRIITGETTKKELDAIEREDRTVKERIPLEVLGNLGFIPLYKDVRKAVNKSIYSSIKEAEKASARTKQREADLLGGYENKEDLKRYNRALYEKNFGEGSEWYESTKEEREEKEKEAKEKRMMKDRLNNYTPESEDGFGSAGFGKSSKKKKSKSSFGTKGFGED